MSALAVVTKDPDSIAPYTIDWSKFLAAVAGGTILTSTWILPSGITSVAQSNDGTTATIKVSGGTIGQDYAVVNRITTSAGLTEDRTLIFRIEDR